MERKYASAPLLETHRRDGLFLSIQQESSSSRPCLGHSTKKLHGHVSGSLKGWNQ